MSENQPTMQSESAMASEPVTVATITSNAAEATAGAYAMMLREIRSWGLWSLGLGAVHLIISGFLSTPWGILLLIVGVASFYFREAAMFIIYGLTLAWAAISNVLSGQAGWIVFALFQLYLAFQVFRKFFHFHRAQTEYAALLAEATLDSPPVPQPAARAFPWAGCLLGTLALGGMIAIMVGVIILFDSIEAAGLLSFFDLLIGLVVNLGVLGLAVGLASLLSGYRYKLLAALGIVASILVLLTWLALALIG